MSKYRRIEINAYRRRVTVVSGECRTADLFDPQQGESEDVVSLDDADACGPVSPDSPEGQLILAEAVRSLEQRLAPEARATIYADQSTLGRNRSVLKRFCSRLRSFFQLNVLHFIA